MVSQGADLELSLAATVAEYQAMIQSLNYSFSALEPRGPRNVTISVSDGDFEDSLQISVRVVGVNDNNPTVLAVQGGEFSHL